jgi:hypothetical protein
LRDFRDPGLVKNKNQSKMKKRFHFFPHFFWETRVEDVFNGGKNRFRLSDSTGEEGATSRGRDP